MGAVFSSLAPTVSRGSTVLFADLQSFLDRQSQFYDGYSYGQAGTPTYYALATRIAALEGASKAVLAPTGMAAVALVNAALLQAGDHVLMPAGAYGSSLDAMRHFFSKWQVSHSLYPHHAGSNIETYMQPATRLVWLESPSSFLYDVLDVAAITAAAHTRGALVAMDNSWATPLGFKPLMQGVDLSVQSLTKYANGHSDVLMGSVATGDESLYQKMRDTAEHLGYCVSSDDCFLVMRGLATLGVRLERQSASGLAVAQWLALQQGIDQVYYPPLPSHPSHELWKAQYSSGNGLMSFTFKQDGIAPVERFAHALKHFRIGAGWGGTDSLIAAYPPCEAGSASPNPLNRWLVRLHVGLEPVDDLITDLAQALSAANSLMATPPSR
jgi:cysteine-S-conjugate beta-lyase